MLFGNEVQMLNGDKAVLKIDECGVLVFPSPWRGKENMGNRITAPLGGIILLEQAEENSICRLSAKKAGLSAIYVCKGNDGAAFDGVLT